MKSPRGKLTLQVVAMPADTNPSGDIFGGWLLSQMDIAGGIYCRSIAKGRVVTVAIESTEFKLPVFVGDTLSCYVELTKQGKTSITVHIEAWVNRDFIEDNIMKATEGFYTFVKVDSERKPMPIS
jgi:acyl-CoA thioesterase YciA